MSGAMLMFWFRLGCFTGHAGQSARSPINGSKGFNSGPWARPVSAFRKGMNSAFPLRPFQPSPQK